jgi:uncharacterized protein
MRHRINRLSVLEVKRKATRQTYLMIYSSINSRAWFGQQMGRFASHSSIGYIRGASVAVLVLFCVIGRLSVSIDGNYSIATIVYNRKVRNFSPFFSLGESSNSLAQCQGNRVNE